MFICLQKGTSALTFFEDIVKALQACELWDPHQISYYQFVGNFHAYLHAKNQLHHSPLL